MKRRSTRLRKRILSVSLAAALVTGGLQVKGNPLVVQEVEAASTSSTMETNSILDERYVKDTEVLRFYKILANAQRLGETEQLSGKPASDILSEYTSEEYTKDVYGTYLTEFSGRINFSGLTITNVDGIGWARSATEIDLSGAAFANALTEVPAHEFAACKALEKIILPGSVKKIGANAFESCLKLKTLVIGSGADGIVDLANVDEVGASAFSSCSSIQQISFAPYGTRQDELKIGEYAFASCESLKEIEIPIKTAGNIGANAFQNCKSLGRAGLQNELAYLSSALFSGAGAGKDESGENVEGLTMYIIGKGAEGEKRLPENITYIGNGCFQGATLAGLDLSGCTKLTKINQHGFAISKWRGVLTLPESLEEMELMAFSSSSLLSIDIPERCTEIGEGAFSRSALVSIRLPKSLKEIKNKTFSECDFLNGSLIIIPEGSALETIGEDAFYKCKSLYTTSFLKDLRHLTSIGDRAFAGCYEVEKVLNVETKNLYKDKKVISGLREVILPDSVVTIGTSVFADNYALRSADLGPGIVHIPDKAFYNSTGTSQKSGAGLEKVIVSGDLDSIGAEAFANQSRLHTVGYKDGSGITVKEGTAQFKDGLLSIGNKAFYGCGIQSSFTVYGGEVFVKKGAVKEDYAVGLSTFLLYDYQNAGKDTNFCRIGYINEEDIVAKGELEQGSYDELLKQLTTSGKEKYEVVYLLAKQLYISDPGEQPSASPGSQTLEVYDTYDTVTDAYQNRLFTMSGALEKREVSEGTVTKEPVDGAEAVWSKIAIGSGNTVDDVYVKNARSRNYELSYVFGLQDVILPDTVIDDNLGESAFEKCINLNRVTLSQNLTEIKANTFSGAGGEVLNALNTQNTAKYYDYYGLRSIVIPDSVKKIGNYAFANCHNLLLQTRGGSSFGTSVESIGENAFSGCYSLDSIRFPTSLLTVGKEAFAKCSVQELKQREIYDENTGKTYKYWRNLEDYGTKGEKKKGLNEIDFTAATKLESIGAGAFKQTNVVTVNMTDAPFVHIPDSLFEQCTYLKTIAFQKTTASVGSNVLKDVLNIVSVTLPASATVKKDMISGVFGKYISDADPTLTFEYDKAQTVILPIGSSKRLPINAINKDNLNGAVNIMVDIGNEQYKSILGKDNAYKGMYAEFNTNDDPHSFILYGTEYISEPVNVRVEVGTSHQYAISDSYMISPHTLEFQVKVEEQPTESVVLSAAEDAYVKNNPAMYVENGSGKILYMPLGKDPSTKGVRLTANLNPLETTDDVEWTSSSPAVTIEDQKYERGSGIATALVKTTEIGDATVTVKSGEKTDTVHVYSVIPVAANGMSCSTAGTFLDTNLKPNSSGSPYGLSIGDTDKLVIKMNYGNTDYTEEQISSYGESCVFTSSDPDVVSVNEDGTFKALAEGDASITVTARGSSAKLQFFFHVENAFSYTPTSVDVSGDQIEVNEKGEKKLTLNIGETVPLAAQVKPSKASQDVTWKVTKGEGMISVDENGIVTALKKGTGAVVAISKEKDTVASKEVTVNVLSPAKELKLLCGDFKLEIGKELTLSKNTNASDTKGFFVSPVDSTDTITWISSNEGVVSVTKSNTQSVTVKAVAAGTAVLTGVAKSGVSASVTITVPGKVIRITGITVDKELTLNVGGTHQLNPQIQPANANESVTYTYTSARPEVATVSESGLVRAVAPGTATITVKTNTGRAASCSVVVKCPASKVALMAKNRAGAKKLYMAKGQTVTLRANLTPKNSTDTLTYKSNKTKIVTVNANGVLSAKKKGTAKITATAVSKKKATITVIVQKKQVKAKKVVLKAPKTIKRGKTARLTVSLKPAKSTDSITYSCNKTAVAKVDEYGYVTGLKKGTVKITVTASSGKKATKKIKIK